MILQTSISVSEVHVSYSVGVNSTWYIFILTLFDVIIITTKLVEVLKFF